MAGFLKVIMKVEIKTLLQGKENSKYQNPKLTRWLSLDFLGNMVTKDLWDLAKVTLLASGEAESPFCLLAFSTHSAAFEDFISWKFLLAQQLPFLCCLYFAVIGCVCVCIWATWIYLHLFTVFILFVSSSGFRMACGEFFLSYGVPCDYRVPYTMGPQ